MSAEGPDLNATEGDAESAPAISVLWIVPAMAAGCAGMGLLSEALHRVFDLPRDPVAVVAGLMAFVCATGLGRPGTFRQAAKVAVVGVAIGVLAELGVLSVLSLAQSLELSTESFAARLLVIGLAMAWGAVAATLAYRWIGMPWAVRDR